MTPSSIHAGVLGSLLVDEPVVTTGQASSDGSGDQNLVPGSDEVMFVGPFDGNTEVLGDGTVSGGAPCKSIFEVLIAERLETARAVLQAWLVTWSLE
jgi:hypothetical protein